MFKKANQIQPIREAVRGHFDSDTINDYAKEGLSGAVGGAIGGAFVGPEGILPGAVGMGLFNVAERGLSDVWYLTRPVEKKVAWLAGDVQEKAEQITKELKGVLPNELLEYLSKFAQSYKSYVDYYIRDNKKGMLEDNAIVQEMQGQTPSTNVPQSVDPEVTALLSTGKKKTKFIKMAEQASPVHTTEDYMAGTAGVGGAAALSHMGEKALLKSPQAAGSAVDAGKALGLGKSLAKGTGGLVGYLGGDWVTRWGYDKIAQYVAGGKLPFILTEIKGCISILEEIDKLLEDLPSNDSKGNAVMAGNYVFTILNNIQDQLKQVAQASNKATSEKGTAPIMGLLNGLLPTEKINENQLQGDLLKAFTGEFNGK